MEEIEIGGQMFPTKCPNECPYRRKPQIQGSFCHRCPIFNCSGDFKLIEPGDYRPDWAKRWKEWFNEGMIGIVELPLYKEDEE